MHVFNSDSRVADCDLDGLPNYAVGRIPVNSTNELATYIRNCVQYEAGGAWTTNALIASDYNDWPSHDFTIEANGIASIVSNYSHVVRCAWDVQGSGTKTSILAAIDLGIGEAALIGHGLRIKYGPSRIDLTVADIGTLEDHSQPAAFVSGACQVGDFGVPGISKSLGEAIVTRAGIGACFVGAAYEIGGIDAKLFTSNLFMSIHVGEAARMGDAVSAGLTSLADANYIAAVRMLQFLGDPALKLPAGDE